MSEVIPEAPAEAVEPEAPAEAPAEDTWQGPSQEEWQQTQEALQQFQNLVQPPVQQQQAQEPPLEFDPFADNPVEQIREIVRRETATYAEFIQNQQYTEGEARGKDVLSDLASRDGDFNVDRAYEIGLARYREAAATQPPSWDLYESCLNSAAKDVRSYEQSIATQAVERFKNELAGLGGARPELGVTTNGTGQFTIPEGGGLMDVVRRHTGGQ